MFLLFTQTEGPSSAPNSREGRDCGGAPVRCHRRSYGGFQKGAERGPEGRPQATPRCLLWGLTPSLDWFVCPWVAWERWLLGAPENVANLQALFRMPNNRLGPEIPKMRHQFCPREMHSPTDTAASTHVYVKERTLEGRFTQNGNRQWKLGRHPRCVSPPSVWKLPWELITCLHQQAR